MSTPEERLDATTYAEIKKSLGDVIPCYAEPGGCVVDDATNENFCNGEHETCLILRAYRQGALDAWAKQANETLKSSQDDTK